MLLTEEVRRFIEKIEPTNHIVLFYDTPEAKNNILFNYVSDGLKKKKGVLCICSDEGPEQVRRGMMSFGIDVEGEEEKGSLLICSYDGWYIENGRAEALRTLSRWNKAYEQFKMKGLGMRVTGETSCFFEHGLVRELMRYEYALHRIFTFPMDAICMYNLRTIVNTGYTDVIMPILRAHGKAIFATRGGSIVIEPENVEDTDVEKLLEIKI